MGKGRKVLSDDHARALIKQAIGMIFGDATLEVEATAEIASIEAQHATAHAKTAKPDHLPKASETKPLPS